MELFRLTRKKYSKVLSGKGAALKGGRWNSAGVELIYTASNRSLAMAEILVHFSLATLPDDYIMLTLQCPDKTPTKEIKLKNLPKDWNIFPQLPNTQHIGDDFVLENKFLLCRVPSVVTQGDFNYLINPQHKLFSKIKIVKREAFRFDRRLFS